MEDHYKTLGLARDASDEVVRAAYRALIQKYHPDRNRSADAPGRTGEIIAAYSVLKRPDLRASYDLELARASVTPMSTAASTTSRRPVKGSTRGRISRWLSEVVLGRERKT